MLRAVAAFLRGGADRCGVAALLSQTGDCLRALQGLDECSQQLCSVIGEI